jgi:hypothetical protein
MGEGHSNHGTKRVELVHFCGRAGWPRARDRCRNVPTDYPFRRAALGKFSWSAGGSSLDFLAAG